MSRSNSYNFSLNRDNLVKRAFQVASIYSLNETIPSEENDFAVDMLNAMLKRWATDPKLWKRKQATLFTAYNTSSYSLGSSGDHCTNTYISTTLSSAAASSATTLSLTSSSGMTIGDNIGIKLDSGVRFWTTIATIPTTTSVTINSGLTSAASSGNTVVSYTSKINRPLRIIRGTNFNLSTSTERKMKWISFDQYFDLPNKTTSGDPFNAFYDKQLDSGVAYMWPTPNNVDIIIKFTYNDTLMDMDSATDDFDFPQEWTEAAILNLACSLALHFSKEDKYQALKPEATASYNQLSNFDSDKEPTIIGISRLRR